MIYFIYGTDIDAARAKARALVDSLLAKKPDASFVHLNSENVDIRFDEYTQSQGLFEQKYIVFLDRIGEQKAIREQLVDNLGTIATSPNIFIILEGKIDKATATKISKKAEKTQEFEKKADAAGASGRFSSSAPSVFALADALGSRDRKKLWVLYREQIDGGTSPEEIHGTLFWQVKSMLLAARTKSATESGLSPYVHSKSAAFAHNFSPAELTTLLDSLISVSHDARRGKHELETALETLLLNI